MRINRLKFHSSQVWSLMTNSKDNSPLTEWQLMKLEEYLTRDKPLTDRMQADLLWISKKAANYNPKKLAATAKRVLLEIYAWDKYKKKTLKFSEEAVSAQKGQVAEVESINLLSEIDGRQYVKNERRYVNKYLTGIPDVVYKVKGKKRVIDVKTCLDVVSFLENIEKELSWQYFFQLLSYLELVGAKEGEICFCLVNMPPEMIDQQIRKIRAKSFLAGNSDERTEEIVNEFKTSMYFDDIPIKRRVIRFKVKADPDLMRDVYERVQLARDWVRKINKSHIFGKQQDAKTFPYLLQYSDPSLQRGEV